MGSSFSHGQKNSRKMKLNIVVVLILAVYDINATSEPLFSNKYKKPCIEWENYFKSLEECETKGISFLSSKFGGIWFKCQRHEIEFRQHVEKLDNPDVELPDKTKDPEWNSKECLEMEAFEKQFPAGLEKLKRLDGEEYNHEFAKVYHLGSEAEKGRERYPLLGKKK